MTLPRQRRKPCKECPFATASRTKGYLGASTPEGFAALILQDAALPCHLRVDYDRKDWREDFIANPAGRYCAGGLIQAANLCKVSRDRTRPSLPADRMGVYVNLQEFVNAHRNAGAHSWSDEVDRGPLVLEVRDRLRLPPLPF